MRSSIFFLKLLHSHRARLSRSRLSHHSHFLSFSLTRIFTHSFQLFLLSLSLSLFRFYYIPVLFLSIFSSFYFSYIYISLPLFCQLHLKRLLPFVLVLLFKHFVLFGKTNCLLLFFLRLFIYLVISLTFSLPQLTIFSHPSQVSRERSEFRCSLSSASFYFSQSYCRFKSISILFLLFLSIFIRSHLLLSFFLFFLFQSIVFQVFLSLS